MALCKKNTRNPKLIV